MVNSDSGIIHTVGKTQTIDTQASMDEANDSKWMILDTKEYTKCLYESLKLICRDRKLQ